MYTIMISEATCDFRSGMKANKNESSESHQLIKSTHIIYCWHCTFQSTTPEKKTLLKQPDIKNRKIQKFYKTFPFLVELLPLLYMNFYLWATYSTISITRFYNFLNRTKKKNPPKNSFLFSFWVSFLLREYKQ